MSDDGTPAPGPGEPEAASDERRELDLLVWDAPNIDMTLSNVIGAKPSPTSRPRFDAIARWFVQAADDRDVEGSVFANIPPAAATTPTASNAAPASAILSIIRWSIAIASSTSIRSRSCGCASVAAGTAP